MSLSIYFIIDLLKRFLPSFTTNTLCATPIIFSNTSILVKTSDLYSIPWIIIYILGIALASSIVILIKNKSIFQKKIDDQLSKNNLIRRDITQYTKSNLDLHKKVDDLDKQYNSLVDVHNQSHTQFQTLFNNVSPLIWYLNKDSQIITGNKFEFLSRKFTVNEAKGLSIINLFGEQAQSLQDLIEEVLKTGKPIEQFESSYKSGIERNWFLIDIYPFKDKKERNLLVIISDITERKEQTLTYYQVMDRFSSGVIIVQDSEIKYVNPRMSYLTGYKEKELWDIPIATLLPEKTKKTIGKVYNESIWNPRNLDVFENILVRKDEVKSHCQYTIDKIQYHLRPADLIVVTDLTVKDQQERQLRDSLNVLHATFDAIDQGIVVLNEDQDTLRYNKKFLDVWNIPESTLNKKKWSYILDEVKNHIKEKPEKFLELFNTDKFLSDEVYTEVLNTDENKMLEITSFPYYVEGKNLGRVLTDKDITEVVKREKELKRARDEAEYASTSKTEFLANMSHEIRTPMNGISGVVTLLELTKLDSKQKRYVDIIKVSADSLLDLINDILDFSKIEAGYLKIEEVEFDLLNTIGAVTDLLALKAQNKGLELLSFVSPDIPNVYIGDSTRLRQILINLGNNAIKFTEKGDITLKCKVDRIERDFTFLHFTVSDTGIGIKTDKIDAIFRSFEQEDVSTTRKFGGTGLGLSISKKLTSLMGGDIWVESEFGKGTDFHFTIKVKNKRDDVYRKEIELFKKENISVYLAASNSKNMHFIKSTLEYYGIKCDINKDKDMILEDLLIADKNHKSYDILLLDQFTGAKNFQKILKSVSFYKELDRTKKVLLMNFMDSATIEIPDNLNIDEILTKPLKRQTLLTCIRKVKNLDQKFDQAINEIIEEKNSYVENDESFSILLAEDNMISQGIITEIFESEGHEVVVANNGVEVLENLEKGSFDMIFMDVNMPVMNGIDATLEIRRREKNTNTHIPIIAMTANASDEEQEKCRKCGMDDSVSKPIKMKELRDLFSKMGGNSHTEVKTEPTPKKKGNIMEINMDYIHESLGDNKRIILKTFELILNRIPTSLRDVRESIAEGNFEKMYANAHGMKGFLNYFDVPEITKRILDLEKAAKDKDLVKSKQIHIEFEPLVQDFLKALKVKFTELSQ